MKRNLQKAKRKYHCPIRDVQRDMRQETGKKLRELRKQRHYTQQTLANLTGVSRSAISNWETFKRTPDIKNYASLARALGVSVFTFVKFEKKN